MFWLFMSVGVHCCKDKVVTGKKCQSLVNLLHLQCAGKGNRIHVGAWQLFVCGKVLCLTLSNMMSKELIWISWCVSAHWNIARLQAAQLLENRLQWLFKLIQSYIQYIQHTLFIYSVVKHIMSSWLFSDIIIVVAAN